jgi:DNA-binding protein YbaB
MRRGDDVAESADRDVNRDLRNRLAHVYGQYARLRSDLDDLQQRLATLQISAASPDGLVRATVGPRGQLIDLWLDRRACRNISHDQLARTIVATVRSAAARTADEVEAMMADYLPADSGALGFLRDNDFGKLMRRPDAALRDLTLRDSLCRDE